MYASPQKYDSMLMCTPDVSIQSFDDESSSTLRFNVFRLIASILFRYRSHVLPSYKGSIFTVTNSVHTVFTVTTVPIPECEHNRSNTMQRPFRPIRRAPISTHTLSLYISRLPVTRAFSCEVSAPNCVRIVLTTVRCRSVRRRVSVVDCRHVSHRHH